VHFLSALVAEGADVYQLFDSWAGMLERAEYLAWAHAYHRAIFERAGGVPRILFVKEGPDLDLMTAAGAEVVSLGKSHDLAAARRDYPHLVFQGNVDEMLLRNGTPEQVAKATRRCLAAGGGHRHILNLCHGVDKATPVANFAAFIAAAKQPPAVADCAGFAELA
jgi:uroporphyrinogen decarboxylase